MRNNHASITSIMCAYELSGVSVRLRRHHCDAMLLSSCISLVLVCPPDRGRCRHQIRFGIDRDQGRGSCHSRQQLYDRRRDLRRIPSTLCRMYLLQVGKTRSRDGTADRTAATTTGEYGIMHVSSHHTHFILSSHPLATLVTRASRCSLFPSPRFLVAFACECSCVALLCACWLLGCIMEALPVVVITRCACGICMRMDMYDAYPMMCM